MSSFETLRLFGCYLADNTFKSIFWWKCIMYFLLEISWIWVPNGPINNNSLVWENDLAPNRQQAIIWTNDGFACCQTCMRHSVSMSLSLYHNNLHRKPNTACLLELTAQERKHRITALQSLCRLSWLRIDITVKHPVWVAPNSKT